MSMYELDGVVKRYAGRTVLDVPRLSVAAGRTLALLGPSGAGKSTLLRLLNFLEPPDGGVMRFDGARVPPQGPPLAARRLVTTVFQRPLLLDANVRRPSARAAWSTDARLCYWLRPMDEDEDEPSPAPRTSW